MLKIYARMSALAGALFLLATPGWAEPNAAGARIPPGARYACPMETHPDQAKPAEQGAYFAAEAGECPWCGMKLKPLAELAWARARRAAEGAEVAYTCPEHQQVFSRTEGNCPRCGHALEPFKVMYTCPDPKHAAFVSRSPGTCPQDGRKLTAFRSIWLSEQSAARNAPPKPEIAEQAKYRCPMHPLVHSAEPGHCTICAGRLQEGGMVAVAAPDSGEAGAQAGRENGPQPKIPADAAYVCPMQECNHFAAEAGRCPECGMRTKPIAEVSWARELRPAASAPSTAPGEGYVCPMHPQERADAAGRCDICGMQLVRQADLPQPKTAPEAIQVQMNYLLEHYLELQERFAADRTQGAAQQALGLIGAADELEKLLDRPGVDLPREFRAALTKLRDAAVKLRSEDLTASRAAFVDLSAAMRGLVEQARPSRNKYGKIYIFHCPMSKGDWLQGSEEIRNPYYGFGMLKCGQLVATH